MKQRSTWGMLMLIMVFWFSVSFITNILGPVIPDIIRGFRLRDLTLAGFIPTFFFIAYALMSIPSGILIEKFGEKKVLLAGFFIPFSGALLFASFPGYAVLLVSCFIMGVGMAMLQTVLNPLQRAVGGEENYAFVAEVAQLMFGVASSVSPWVYTRLIESLRAPAGETSGNAVVALFAALTPDHLPWVSLYWLFAFILGTLFVVVLFVRFPKVETNVEESTGGRNSYKTLFGKKLVWLFFLGIFSYVSAEQSISIFMSTFLEKYHGIDPFSEGAACVSRFWGMMTVGCIVGMVLLKLIDSRKVLLVSGVGAVVLLVAGLYGSASVAVWALPCIGFFASMMYSIIFSLALNSVSAHHGAFAGILCSGIAGGAVGPLVVSMLADAVSLRMALTLVVLFMTYIACMGVWARPLVNNKTVSWRSLLGKGQSKH